MRVTDHNEEAVALSKCAAKLLEGLYQGKPMSEALEFATTEAPDPGTLNKARSGDHLAATAVGDSCGRAWIIGAAMAAMHGVDGQYGILLSWLGRLNDSETIFTDIEALVGKQSGLWPEDPFKAVHIQSVSGGGTGRRAAARSSSPTECE